MVTWQELVTSGHLQDIGVVPFQDLGSPWSHDIHLVDDYDRLFWSVRREGLKTPLLVREWKHPFRAKRVCKSCKSDGNRLDSTPSIVHNTDPKYEIVIGNMRWCAAYVCGYDEVPCLLLSADEQQWQVEDLWDKYHPLFEADWYK